MEHFVVVLDFHVVVILELLVFGIVDLFLLVSNFVLNGINLVQIGSPRFLQWQPLGVRQSNLQFALLLLDLEAVYPFNLVLDVFVDDSSFGHHNEQVFDVYLLQLGWGGGRLEVGLEDGYVAQLSPALNLIFLLHLYQSVFQPELEEVFVFQVALLVDNFDHIVTNRFFEQLVNVLWFCFAVYVSVVVFLEFELHEVTQARVVAEFQDDVLLSFLLEPIFIPLGQQPF